MKNLLISLTIVLAVCFVGCSKEDNRNCDSCKTQGVKIEICDNEDGTYTLKGGGETEKLTKSDLGNQTQKAYVEGLCTLGNTLADE
ncbi:hypothetical protein [Flagellimonas meishanensis]|uniref:hypothetical protein n=1 Tax=Flagellimonas meishanensis TaxID=2873264 RepID=UPI001CA726FF|nr:hypothetical protein [[Muricauda] meishanensis]